MPLEITLELAEKVYLANKDTVQEHLQALDEIIRRELNDDPSTFEGNAFYMDKTFDLMNELIPKQIQLFALGGHAASRICEIGFNAGHSMLLFLLGRRILGAGGGSTPKPIDCYIFDINEHVYTEPALAYLRKAFPEATFRLFEGDSIEEVQTFVTCHKKEHGSFDLVHIDGGHEEPCIQSDLACSHKLVRPNGYIIVDDTDDEVINRYVEGALRGRHYEEVSFYDSLPMYPHRILKRIGA